MDITLIPRLDSTGRIPSGLPSGCASPGRSIRGMEGPVMSASRMPTAYPRRASVMASSADTEDLPTPPLPLTTAITWRTWLYCSAAPSVGSLWCSLARSWAVISPRVMSAVWMPSSASTACRAAVTIWSRSGQARVVSASVNATLPSARRRSRTMPSSTMLRRSSGSTTAASARSTSCSDGIAVSAVGYESITAATCPLCVRVHGRGRAPRSRCTAPSRPARRSAGEPAPAALHRMHR